MIRRQFDTLYAEGAQSGRVMAICLHPYLIGVPHRIAGLDEALGYIPAHDGVWFATGEEIVRALAAIGRDVLSRGAPARIFHHKPSYVGEGEHRAAHAKSASGWRSGRHKIRTVDTAAATHTAGPPGETRNTASPPARISPAAIGERPRSTAECQTEPRQRPHSRARR